MAAEEPKKVEPESPQPQHPPPESEPETAPVEEKSVVPLPLPPPPPAAEDKADDTKALAVVEKPIETPVEKSKDGSGNRDVELARVETDKKLSLIRAWEENEKSKAENNSTFERGTKLHAKVPRRSLNRAQKKFSTIGAWENSKKASIGSDLKNFEEKMEKKKAEYAETMKNKIASVHKLAEEKRAIVEAKKGEDLLKAEEMAAKYRASGLVPKKLLLCFGG
ncbi:hypothetical protein ACJRO7_006152 [Eucalyptus globulus]|uniref:Remorin n=1 Tax=Eucalyptus globulus TaxID=34317 RepID=A0ABD3IJK0_EUCGL